MRPKARALLTSLAACSGVLLCLLGLLFQRQMPGRERLSQRASQDRSAPPALSADGLSAAAPPELRADRVELDRSPSARVVALPAFIAGHLTIDGATPAGAELTLRTEDGVWVRTARLAHDGNFSFADVPPARVRLSFELQPSESRFEQRQILLPFVELAPRSGEQQELKLDWTTRQLNVRVIDEGLPASYARVDVDGPQRYASFTTNEKGTAKLSLVGTGRFSFKAVEPGGKSGQTTLESGADEQLSSVVIALERP